MDEAWVARVSAIAALGEPTRRRLYEFVVRSATPVGRDEVAEATGVPRTTVAFHLDKLVAEGVLEVVNARRTGGPGAGRPAKLYRRCAEPIAVSLPERRYELAARLMADAFLDAETTGRSPRAALRERARQLGREMAGDTVVDTLSDFGFEPRRTDTAVVLVNCPFHRLAQQHTELICGMNLCLVAGILDGLGESGLVADLAPTPGHCCVRVQPVS